MRKILLALVEDQLLFREGLKSIIHHWQEMEVILETGDGVSCMEKLKRADPLPDVVLLDLSLPPVNGRSFDGLDVTQAVRSLYPGIKIIILSVHQDDDYIAHLIELGAHGYLVKDTNPAEVRKAIESVHQNGFYLNLRTMQAIQKALTQRKRPPLTLEKMPVLSEREKEILDLVCKQMTDGEIAEKLFISTKTVNGHRTNLLQKTGSRNTAGLVVFALKNKIVNP